MNEKETIKLEEEFHVSKFIIFYKFILGLSELILGLGVLILGKRAVVLYNSFKTGQLFEDPNTLLIHIAEKLLPYIFSHRVYIILVLVLLGLAKIIGAIGLVYKKTWGLDLLLFVTLLILPFQLFSFIRKPSLFDFIYILVGIFIVFWLVNFKPNEYIQKLKKRNPFN